MRISLAMRYVPSNALFNFFLSKVIVKINIYSWTWQYMPATIGYQWRSIQFMSWQYILTKIGYRWRSIQCMSQFVHCITLQAIHFVNIRKAKIYFFGWPSCIIQWPLGLGWAKLSIGWQRVELTLEWSSPSILSMTLKLCTSLDDFVNIILNHMTSNERGGCV